MFVKLKFKLQDEADEGTDLGGRVERDADEADFDSFFEEGELSDVQKLIDESRDVIPASKPKVAKEEPKPEPKIEEEEEDDTQDSDNEFDFTFDDEDETQISEGQKTALDSGWLDKQDWIDAGRNPDNWVDWKEYNKRGELYAEINTLKQELARSNKLTNKQIKRLLANVNKDKLTGIQERNNALIKELQSKYLEARESGDIDAAFDYRDKLDELKDRLSKDELAIKEQLAKDSAELGGDEDEETDDKDLSLKKLDPEFQKSLQKLDTKFRSANPWYGKDKVVTSYFDTVLRENLTDVSEEDRMDVDVYKDVIIKTIKQVRKDLPNHAVFKRKPNVRSAISDTAKRTGTRRQGKARSISQLPTEMQKIARASIESFGITEQELLNEPEYRDLFKELGIK